METPYIIILGKMGSLP
uniref:Uncharacterized protein n=1 Tax=Anguilla anguilla TaxID=7936 RepID=A0A0E9RD75_ANGAN